MVLNCHTNPFAFKVMKKSSMIPVFTSIWTKLKPKTTGVFAPEASDSVDVQGRKRQEVTHEVISSYIREDSDDYLRVLTFQPIDLDVLHGKLQTSGLFVTKPRLREILDDLRVFVSYGQVGHKTKNRTKRHR
jgi:hypothetical protein